MSKKEACKGKTGKGVFKKKQVVDHGDGVWGMFDLPFVETASSCRRRDLAPADQATCRPRIHRTGKNVMSDSRSDITSDMTYEGAICEKLHVVSFTYISHAVQGSGINQGKLCRADEPSRFRGFRVPLSLPVPDWRR